MDISMDIRLAHLLIKFNIYMLCPCIIFPCLSFLLFIFSFVYVIESNEGKMQLAAFDGASQNPPPNRRKNHAKISYESQVIANFVSNFVAIATGSVGEKCNWQHSIAQPRKPPYRRKNLLRKPSYSQFCPKFCCHCNKGRSGKM